jgi:hypothetical protein
MCFAVRAALVILVLAAAATSTRVVSFAAFTVGGVPTVKITRTLKGSCYSESLAADRDDAYRCISGNFLYDPCFSAPVAVHAKKGIVVCPVAPWTNSGVEVKLTKRFPKNTLPKPSTRGLPWAIETVSGCKAPLDTGATMVIARNRANYYCSNTKQWLWGTPSRKTEPWSIYIAAANATRLSKRIAIKEAWF